jgi:hypothetical protein
VKKARLWLALPALIALGRPVAAEATGDDMPSRSCPALAAAPLVCTLVFNPLGAATWAESELETIRIGACDEAREEMDSRTSFILLALHTRSADEYALEMMEAPREPEPAPARPGKTAFAMTDPRLEDAFEAMGLTPADFVGTRDDAVPPAALAVAEVLAGLLDWGLQRGADLRERVLGSSLYLDPEDPHVRQPGYVFYKNPPPPKDEDREVPLVITKKIVRSVYKMLLGVAIGVLIWAFVRNAA